MFLHWKSYKKHCLSFLHKSHTSGKSGSWDLGQNSLGQSDCRIFKSTLSLEQNDEKAFFFAFWYRHMELKINQKILGGHRQKWEWSLWSQISKIGCISRRNSLNKPVFGVLIKIQKRIFWLVVVEIGPCLFGLWTLLYLKNEFMKWADLLHADTNLGKLIGLRGHSQKWMRPYISWDS